MVGFFGKRATFEQYEHLLLISESVKSGLSLSDSIRLATSESDRSDRSLMKFADLLDQGMLPDRAAIKADLPPDIRDLFLKALDDSEFAEALRFQVQLENDRRRITMGILRALAYPVWLIVSAAILLQIIVSMVVVNMEPIIESFSRAYNSNFICLSTKIYG